MFALICLSVEKIKGNSHCITLDLSTVGEIRGFWVTFQDRFPDVKKLDILVHNAADIKLIGGKTNYQGLDLTMMINYYGPWLLTHMLTPLLIEAGKTNQARVIILSSILHGFTELDLDKSHKLHAHKSYHDSKSAGILFGMELAERFKKQSNAHVRVHTIFPGCANTHIYDVVPITGKLWAKFQADPAHRAANVICLAADDKYKDKDEYNGKYFMMLEAKNDLDASMYNLDKAKGLWHKTEQKIELLKLECTFGETPQPWTSGSGLISTAYTTRESRPRAIATTMDNRADPFSDNNAVGGAH